MNEIKDSFGAYLDKINTADVSDNSIFVSLPRFWESDFHSNMTSLNVEYKGILSCISTIDCLVASVLFAHIFLPFIQQGYYHFI